VTPGARRLLVTVSSGPGPVAAGAALLLLLSLLLLLLWLQLPSLSLTNIPRTSSAGNQQTKVIEHAVSSHTCKGNRGVHAALLDACNLHWQYCFS
jgi:hypothetical protein